MTTAQTLDQSVELTTLTEQRRTRRIKTIERAIEDIQEMRDQDVPAGQRNDLTPGYREYSEAVTKLRALQRLQ